MAFTGCGKNFSLAKDNNFWIISKLVGVNKGENAFF
jgi:hypothetical protein